MKHLAIDRNVMPATYEALRLEAAKDAIRKRTGEDIRLIGSGFVLRRPGLVVHCKDQGDLTVYLSQEGSRIAGQPLERRGRATDDEDF